MVIPKGKTRLVTSCETRGFLMRVRDPNVMVRALKVAVHVDGKVKSLGANVIVNG